MTIWGGGGIGRTLVGIIPSNIFSAGPVTQRDGTLATQRDTTQIEDRRP
jgi:hypothetical protein